MICYCLFVCMFVSVCLYNIRVSVRRGNSDFIVSQYTQFRDGSVSCYNNNNNNNNNNKSFIERRNYVYIFYCAARAPRCYSAAQCYII